MPELPEVETLKRELNKKLTGKKIVAVKLIYAKTIKCPSPQKFQIRVKNIQIKFVARRAKVLIIELENNESLLVHLKMTGQLIYAPLTGSLTVGGHPQISGTSNLPNKYTRLVFTFSDQTKLHFNDLRKFGWFKLVTNEEKIKLLSHLGIEPLSPKFSLANFTEILNRYPKRKLKQLLLDQTLIAGLGNIYVDEACFLARVLPTRITGTITKNEVRKLHQAITAVLKLSIKHKGTSAKNYVRSDGQAGGFVPHLNVYGRSKLPCKKCRRPISKIKLSGRGTHFCEHCQH